jgi:hypothetical protein
MSGLVALRLREVVLPVPNW